MSPARVASDWAVSDRAGDQALVGFVERAGDLARTCGQHASAVVLRREPARQLDAVSLARATSALDVAFGTRG